MPTRRRCSKRYRRISEAGGVKRRGELKTCRHSISASLAKFTPISRASSLVNQFPLIDKRSRRVLARLRLFQTSLPQPGAHNDEVRCRGLSDATGASGHACQEALSDMQKAAQYSKTLLWGPTMLSEFRRRELSSLPMLRSLPYGLGRSIPAPGCAICRGSRR